MKAAWRHSVLSVVMFLVAGCAMYPYDIRERSTRPSEKMAPANPNRGSKTIRVTTRTPPELEVRLVTFYSQFYPSLNVHKAMPRGGKIADDCWLSRSSLLQEERYYYTREFFYAAGNGAGIQDLVLDEIVPGTCHIDITGIGYEVALRVSNGNPVTRYLVRFDIAVEEGGEASAEATIWCKVITQGAGITSALRCNRERLGTDAFHLGPLATSGAALTLDFRLANMATQ
jgi:hypothetical protein